MVGRPYNDRGEKNLAQCNEVEEEMDERSPRGRSFIEIVIKMLLFDALIIISPYHIK